MHIINDVNLYLSLTCRVGQNHKYTVYIRYFWQGNHQCIYYKYGQPYLPVNEQLGLASKSGDEVFQELHRDQ